MRPALEGTVGGHWGLLDAQTRAFKFVWGEAVSNHPLWKLQAAGGIAFAVLVLAAGWLARSGTHAPGRWLAVTVNATTGGLLIPWSIANVPVESLGIGGWARSLALVAVAALAPPLLSVASLRGTLVPPFWRIIGPSQERARNFLALSAGLLLIALMLLAIQSALGLVFDPRYLDFPFAPLTAATEPFLLHSLIAPRPAGGRATSELTAAGVLALSVPYIVLDESLANWESLWLCAAFAALAFILARARDGRS
jgi:hypothetical protein